MCGIVGAIAERDVTPILVEGLRRLEYRGYDSAGIAVLNPGEEDIVRIRTEGKVQQLADAVSNNSAKGFLGIAHTRWATHGKPTENNAHPHLSSDDIALVHNGIIENHSSLRDDLSKVGYAFSSQTDTESAVHTIHKHLAQNNDLLLAVHNASGELDGAFAFGIIRKQEPKRMIAMRRGSPLVVGLGINEYFIASDVLALLPVAQKFIYLEDNDIADISIGGVKIFDQSMKEVKRKIHIIDIQHTAISRGKYRHFMLKEIFEQARAVSDTLEGRLADGRIMPQIFGVNAAQIFEQVQRVHIVACGTSYHAGLVAKYWLESIAGISCSVEIASEFRYRNVVIEKNTLFVSISQSGETADTLAALKKAKTSGYLSTLCICNAPESTLVRESELIFLTRAGIEIGVASTKAFTTQLTSLFMLTMALTKQQNSKIVQAMKHLPALIDQALLLNDEIKTLAEKFAEKNHALFLGRGLEYPIALEGALKLKEISYIHAEAYPAGELKHGPLALVDKNMPVIAIAPNDELLEKLKSNLHEVDARGGQLIVFADKNAKIDQGDNTFVISMPNCLHAELAPIVYTIPLQLLAYHVAVLKGTDIDQPRNLAKSVTVE